MVSTQKYNSLTIKTILLFKKPWSKVCFYCKVSITKSYKTCILSLLVQVIINPLTSSRTLSTLGTNYE